MIPEELRVLYPNLSDDELIAAKENLDQYLLLAWEILMEDQQGGEPSFDSHTQSS